ncbi:MAG: DUF4286 family protein [Ginsengibacter sp.]
MVIYNITTKVENKIASVWLQWQNEVYVPEVMNTGLFSEYRFFKLLGQDEADGKTYILQFYASNKNLCEAYVEEHAQTLRNKEIEKWGDNFVSFRSLLESVQ